MEALNNRLTGVLPSVLPVLERIPNVRKIAALRANALGDFLFATPALIALRSAYPGAEIVLLGQKWHARFLQGRPGPVDRVIPIPGYPGVGELEDFEPDTPVLDRFFAAMRQERFDLALQIHGGGRNSNPFVHRLGARVTAGLRTPDAPPLDRWLRYVSFQQESMRYLEVAALVGAQPVVLAPQIAVTEADLAESRVVLAETPQPLVVIHPGVSRIDRRWPPERFAAVGDALAMAGGRVAVTGAGPEAGLTQTVVNSMEEDAVDLCDRLSLGGLTGLLSRAALVIANDTGPLHLAAAVGTPTVGLYRCFNVINSAPITRASHRPIISWQLECPICGRNDYTDPCGHPASYMEDVPADEVIAQALDLFDGRARER